MNERITDPTRVAAYVESARVLYGLHDTSVEIAEPPVVVQTPTGARVMAWLPVDENDLTA